MQNPVVAIRLAKGLTVSELGVLTDVSPMTIERIERGT
ncbi:helix-turn-helix transcriptional regulator [Neobacillus drentensis]